jgi:hypothetical protein
VHAGLYQPSDALLIDATALFVSDYADVTRQLRAYHANRPIRIDDERSWVDGALRSPGTSRSTPRSRDRVGYFVAAQKDFSRDQEKDRFVRYVNRWRLEKRDNGAPVSEPVQPIVYYIDRTRARAVQALGS